MILTHEYLNAPEGSTHFTIYVCKYYDSGTSKKAWVTFYKVASPEEIYRYEVDSDGEYGGWWMRDCTKPALEKLYNSLLKIEE